MTNEKICIHCCTVYQLFVACCLRIGLFKNNSVTLVMSKSVPNSIRIIQRLSETKFFNELFLIDNETVDWNKGIYNVPFFRNQEMKKILKNTPLDNYYYDTYLFAGLGGFSNSFGQWLLKYNPKLKIEMYEEGASSYSRIYEEAIQRRKCNSSFHKRIFYKFFPHALKLYSCFYYFTPELVLWGDKSSYKKIPALQEYIDEIRRVLNYVFEYDALVDDYHQRVIFFEESYYNDGIDVDDISIVNQLAVKYGQEAIFVKRHPRNKENRFAQVGFVTSHDSSVPWELIAMNLENLDEKILVTMTSTALISTFLLLNSNAKMIFKVSEMPEDNARIKYTKEVILKLCSLFPTRVSEEI